MIVFAFYCALHITFLSLHNALSIRNTAQIKLHTHQGMSKCPLITFSVLFVVIVIIAFTVTLLDATSLKFWNSYFMFYVIHLSSLDAVM